jgi:hypothetical protein
MKKTRIVGGSFLFLVFLFCLFFVLVKQPTNKWTERRRRRE